MPPIEHSLTVAAFDVDGTLTTRDCVLPFVTGIVGWRRALTAVLRRPVALARRDRDSVKAALLSSLRGRPIAELEQAGAEFVRGRVTTWLRPDTVERLRRHRRDGHRVVLVSASLRPYLAPLAEHVGADAVLCCELEADGGVATGRIAGVNCRGPEKVRRLREWLGDDADRVTLWAYGDSSGDRELLAAAHHPHLVRRERLAA